MVDVLDVATAIVERSPRLTTMQLQKLTYYVQAWHTTIYGEPAFGAEFQAWKDGPVAPELHERYRGLKWVGSAHGESSKLTAEMNEIVGLVIAQYGLLDGEQLSLLTHAEMPWLVARGDTPPEGRCQTPISLASMSEYYANKVLAGQTAFEIALVGANPFSRDAEEVAEKLSKALSDLTLVPENGNGDRSEEEPRYRSGFTLDNYVEETTPTSFSR